MVIVHSVVIAIVMSIVWPFVQGGINAFGVWIAQSSKTAPFIAPFVYGTLERLLLPFGLHHMLTIPMNYNLNRCSEGQRSIRSGSIMVSLGYRLNQP